MPTAMLFIIDDRLYVTEPDGSGYAPIFEDGRTFDSAWLLASAGGTAFFRTYTEATGNELWRTDGTAAGTQLVTDLRQGPGSAGPDDAVAFGDGKLLFRAFVGEADANWGLFVHDTRTGGTERLDGFADGRDFDARPQPLGTLGDEVLFYAGTPWTGGELFVSDGTDAGTRPLETVPGIYEGGAFVQEVGTPGGRIVFAGSPDGTAEELWVTDGTQAGTRGIVDLWGNGGRANFSPIHTVGEYAVFTADPEGSAGGPRLWTSDGTTAGTVAVTQPGALGSTVSTIASVGDVALVRADDFGRVYAYDPAGPGGPELIASGSLGASFDVAEVGATGRAVFANTTTAHGTEIWVTDGTAAGTRLLRDIRPGGEASSDPSLFTAIGDVVYFAVQAAESGVKLWVTDGTRAGTRPVERGEAPHEMPRFGVSALYDRDVLGLEIDLDGANGAPRNLALSSRRVDESTHAGSAVGEVVGRLSARDPDGDALTFRLANDAGGRFELRGRDLVVARDLDHEAAASHRIVVVAADPDGARTREAFDIRVRDLPDPTGGADTLTLTRGRDIVSLFGGDDTARALGGDDVVRGNGGDDRLFGQGGADTLMGQNGADRLLGQKGADTLFGGGGRDTLLGGGGDDALRGGQGRDALEGGAGRDDLKGGGGADTLRGGEGRDEIDGGAGRDVLWGGRGADDFAFGRRDGTDVIRDFEVGRDRIDLTGTGLEMADIEISRADRGRDVLIEFARTTVTLDGVRMRQIDEPEDLFVL